LSESAGAFRQVRKEMKSMKISPKAFVIALLLLLSIAFLSGCWGRREPEELVHALILGFDIDNRGLYEVTAQFSNPLTGGGPEAGGAGSGRNGQKSFWTYSAKGSTPFEAIGNMSLSTPRIIRLTHVQLLIFSERLARRGLGPVLDFIEHDHELRLSTSPAVVEGDLKKLLESDLPLENIPSAGLSRLMRLIKFERSATTGDSMLVKLQLLSRPGVEMAISRFKFLELEENSRSTIKPPAALSGDAVFKDDRMVGWFEVKESRGLQWIRGMGRSEPVVLASPQGGPEVTINLFEAKSEIEPVIEDEEVKSIQVMVRAHGSIHSAPGLDLRQPEVVESLRKRLAAALLEDMEASLAKAKEFGVDVFGFGSVVYRKHYPVWERSIGENWPEIFVSMPVDIEVEAIVHRPGMVTKTVKSN